MKIQTLLLAFSLFAASCNTETKTKVRENDVTKKYDYHISIDVWNGFNGYESIYVLNNLQIYNNDSAETNSPLSKPLTLFCISTRPTKTKANNRTLITVDTIEIPFSKAFSDTLFALTKEFLGSLEFNNYDTTGQLVPRITDDSHAKVELNYGGKILSATISSINNPTISTKELDTLRNYIRKFKPLQPQ